MANLTGLSLREDIGSSAPELVDGAVRDKGTGRQLDAFVIGLSQAEGRKWYASTLQLQLASFDACVACRGVRTLRVTVDKRMPLSLWGVEDTLRAGVMNTEGRRLPTVRAAGVVWKMPTCMLVPLLLESTLLKNVEWMQVAGVIFMYCNRNSPALSHGYDLPPLGTLLAHSPKTYFEAMRAFFKRRDHTKEKLQTGCSIVFPPKIRQLSLSWVPDERLDLAALPGCLENLLLGGRFNQPIGSAVWPVTLQQLTLGMCFDQPIDDVVWPASLLKLTFGTSFDQPIANVTWPANLIELIFGENFDQPMKEVVWPASLLRLASGDSFNQPVNDVKWPPVLDQLVFGYDFDQPITDVEWPPLLNRLTFGHSFNHPVHTVSWPSSLRSLVFGTLFDQPIEDVVWPLSLGPLLFADSFNRVVDGVDWPPCLDDFQEAKNQIVYVGFPCL